MTRETNPEPERLMRVIHYRGYTIVERAYGSDLGVVEYEVRTSSNDMLLATFDKLKHAKGFCHQYKISDTN